MQACECLGEQAGSEVGALSIVRALNLVGLQPDIEIHTCIHV